MRLTRIEAENWLAHRYFNSPITPLTMIVGPNGSGKSSIRDAIGFGMLGELTRVEAKGDRVALITDGAASGKVSLSFGDAVMSRDVKTGKLAGPADWGLPGGAHPATLPLLLQPATFAALDSEGRRTALMGAMNVSVSLERIVDELKRRDFPVKIMPGEDFPFTRTVEEWCAKAATKATEARGAWKQITGETYGAKKAEGWSHPDMVATGTAPAGSIDDARAEIAACERDIEAHQRDLGRIEGAERSQGSAATRAALSQEAGHLQAAAETLAAVDADIADAKNRLLLAQNEQQELLDALEASRAPRRPPELMCPHCGAASVLVAGKPAMPETQGVLPEPPDPKVLEEAASVVAAHVLLVNKAESRRAAPAAALRSAEQARDALAKLDRTGPADAAEADDLPVRRDVEAQLELTRTHLAGWRDELARLLRGKERSEKAESATAAAAKQHTSVQNWVKLADLLAPSGIPSEMLNAAIGPFNASAARIAAALRFGTPVVGPDMAITMDGRAYGLCSESEQWRADAVLALALAEHSRMRIVALDRFDVLDLPSKEAAISGLYGLVKRGDAADTIIVLGTMKAAPPAPRDVMVVWTGPTLAAKAAA
jgi:hypothetical protein